MFPENMKNRNKMMKFEHETCTPCKDVDVYIERLTNDYPGFAVEYVDVFTDKGAELANEHKVRSTPTVLFMVDGEVKDRIAGFGTYEMYENVLKEYFI